MSELWLRRADSAALWYLLSAQIAASSISLGDKGLTDNPMLVVDMNHSNTWTRRLEDSIMCLEVNV
jgi:hypothetical protein